ncbi:2156_t:CDS:2 [Entrophospora sp. SA101]|nr:2156_t:CDS:2 [Entrophospora sp. SA101]
MDTCMKYFSSDWNKYQENQFVTGSVDKIIKIWDLRFPNREVMCLMGHEYAASLHHMMVISLEDWILICQIATCAWDEHIHVLQPPALTRKPFV